MADGFIEVLAGGGIGDQGPSEESILRGVDAVAVDADGSIYVGENSRGLIRKIDTDGTITTIAGTGVRGATVGLPRAGLEAEVASILRAEIEDLDNVGALANEGAPALPS